MVDNLKYDDPRNLCIKKMHEIIYGIEWFDNEKNKQTYEAEKSVIIGLK